MIYACTLNTYVPHLLLHGHVLLVVEGEDGCMLALRKRAPTLLSGMWDETCID